MEYAHPEVLVDTEWVSQHPPDLNRRLVEVDYDPDTAYKKGHIAGATLIWWGHDINDPVANDIITMKQFEDLMSRNGITPDTDVILYGDFNNWFATFVFWIFKYYGHQTIEIMNGGRKKWELEGRNYTSDEPQIAPSSYHAKPPDEKLRAYILDASLASKQDYTMLVDVRSPKEFSGETSVPPELHTGSPEPGGNIPGAINIPWSTAVNDADGTFKSADELLENYKSKEVTPDKNVICYCRIGERASHSWFVLKYLLGYDKVKNYDGSWSEWDNMKKNPLNWIARHPKPVRKAPKNTPQEGEKPASSAKSADE